MKIYRPLFNLVSRERLRKLLNQKFTLPQLLNRVKYEMSDKGKALLVFRPTWMTVYVSDRCNLACGFCVNQSPDRANAGLGFHEPLQDMTLARLREILDKTPEIMVVTLAGIGEPTVNPEIYDMAREIRGRHMRANLITNGVLLKRDADKVLSAGFNEILVSVNAVNESAFAAVVNKPPHTFGVVIDGVRAIIQRRGRRSEPKVRIAFVCTKSNYRQMHDFISLGKELRVDGVRFHNLITDGMKRYEIDQCLFEDDQDVVQYIRDLKEAGHGSGWPEVEFPPLLPRHVQERKCQWYHKNLCVDSNGSVSGCGRFIVPRPEYGNVLTNRDAWNGQHFRDMREMFSDSTIPLLSCCQHCVENARQ
ncbi:MAG TPA: radical SAM protein [Pyrinomonadaceae bacterium]|jgi:radical SAM protein with 4Fe4S-binding SPASM domain